MLRKNNLPAGNIIEKSDELLKSLMASATASEKFHTKYLYENGFSSMNLPYNIHMWIVVKEERIGTKSVLVCDRNQVSVSGTKTKVQFLYQRQFCFRN